MPDYSFGWPSRDHGTLVRSAIRSWRDGLINLTGSNRLLNFRPSRTGMISLLRPAPEEVLSRLARGGTYHFRPLVECHCFGASMRERACASVRTRAMPRPVQSELFSISSRSIAA